jgi:serine/threonine protein kinase
MMLERMKDLLEIRHLYPHKNILDINEWFLRETKIIIIFDYIEGVITLEKFLSEKLEYSKLFNIMEEIVSTLILLHSMHIAHRDIKPENILMKDITPILIDFGYSCFYKMEEVVGCRGSYGTPLYAAPEMYFGSNIDYFAADRYSIGVIFFFIMNNKFPYPDKGITARDLFIMKREGKILKSESGYERLDLIIDGLLNPFPIKRPNLDLLRVALVEAIRQY